MGSIFCIGQSAYDITIPLDGAICKYNLRIFIVNKRECCIRATFFLSFLYRMMRRGTIYVKRDIKTGKRRLSKPYV